MVSLFQIFGNPETIVSDRGTSFTSQEFANFINARGIKHRKVAVAAPWANGSVERVNRFLKSSLAKLVEDPSSWQTWLSVVQYVINNTHHTSLKTTPVKLFLGFDQRNHSDCKLTCFLSKIANTELNAETSRYDARKLAIETINRIKTYNKQYYDKKTP